MFENQNKRPGMPNFNPNFPPPVAEIPSSINPSSPKLSPEKKSSKLSLILEIIGVILFLSISAAGAYFYYTNIYATPEKILFKAIDNTWQSKSGTVSIQTASSYKTQQSPTSAESMTNSILGQLAKSDSFNLNTSIKVDFNRVTDFIQTNTELKIEVPTGQSIPLLGDVIFNPTINVVSLDKEGLFFKIVGIPVVPFFDTSVINDKWINLNFQQVKDQYGIKFTQTESFNQQDIDKIIANLKIIYKKDSYLKITKLANEKVENIDTYHYRIDVDKNIFKTYLTDVKDYFVKEGYDKKYAINFDNFPGRFDEDLAKSTLSVETWIAIKDRTFKKILLDSNTVTPEAIANIKNTVTFRNLNQTIKIEAPKEYKSLQEIITSLMGQYTQQAQVSAEGASVMNEIRMIQNGLEIFYVYNGHYPLPPVGGNQLGKDAICITEKGFGQEEVCSKGSIAEINLNKEEYLYYLCDNKNYLVRFNLPSGYSNYGAGRYYIDLINLDPKLEGDSFEIDKNCLDLDKDGLPNYLEEKFGTDLNKGDSDNDKYLDGAEVIGGFNPNGTGKLTAEQKTFWSLAR